MADEEIVGSRMKSQRARGQAQDQTGVTVPNTKALPEIPNVSPPNAVLPANRGADTTLDKSKKPTPAVTRGMHANTGSPSGKVGANERPSSVPAPKGSHPR
jgi:hypothetical protein